MMANPLTSRGQRGANTEGHVTRKPSVQRIKKPESYVIAITGFV
jgi:hypothetical protein